MSNHIKNTESELDMSMDLRDTNSKSEPKKNTGTIKGGWKENSPNSLDERLKPRLEKELDDSDTDIPFIPDVESSIATSVQESATVAPNVAVNRVSTYKELDLELSKLSSLHALGGGVDIKLLTSRLLPESEVQEETKALNWDQLFTDVKSQLYPESDLRKNRLSSAAVNANTNLKTVKSK